jgi:phytoene dehydrogenase-like protein
MANKYHGALVVGSGPNGLAAAITMQRAGIPTLLLEGASTVGGGMRTAQLTLPGFLHDVCSAVHPIAAVSPFFQQLPLSNFGLEFIHPPVLAAHPFDDATAAVLLHSLDATASRLEGDADAYRRLIGDLIPLWPKVVDDILGPPGWPQHPGAMARFGLKALMPATLLASRFKSDHARGLFAGMAAHSMQPLSGLSTSAIALALSLAGHLRGWPIPKSGSQKIADAMAAYFLSLGGKIETGEYVHSYRDLPEGSVVFFDTGPEQLRRIMGDRLSQRYTSQLQRFRRGPGVFKVDWAIEGQVPFAAEACRKAGTVHLGGTIEEIAAAEHDVHVGRISERPFVLLVQQSVFDTTRTPEGKHAVWAYCHVPNGCQVDMTDIIERQIERYAPGFRERILARHIMGPADFEAYNPNYAGGDINGGAMNLRQILLRPVANWSPYRTSATGFYLCSASTPPGGGVHGQCGYHAARQAIKDHFHELYRESLSV